MNWPKLYGFLCLAMGMGLGILVANPRFPGTALTGLCLIAGLIVANMARTLPGADS